MKGNRMPGRKIALLASIILFALFQAITGVLSEVQFHSDENFGCDLRFRRNEVRCAHQGVNSFRIWNHECELEGFRPLSRPDKETKH